MVHRNCKGICSCWKRLSSSRLCSSSWSCYHELDLDDEYVDLVLVALKACSCSKEIEHGRKMHCDTISRGRIWDVYVGNSLIHMYAQCGSMAESRNIFDSMMQRRLADSVSWNSLIHGHVSNHENKLALELFSAMSIPAPDSRTFVAALMAVAALAQSEQGRIIDGRIKKLKCLETGAAIHAQAAKSGCDSVIFVANTLVAMYAKCGSIKDAESVFRSISQPTVVSWNAMILGYAENEEPETGLELFKRMQSQGFEPSDRTYVAAAVACANLAAKEEKATKIICEGREQLVKLECLEQGMAVHSQAAAKSKIDVFLASVLIDMYAKCGSMLDARLVFDKLRGSLHDTVSWTALIRGYVQNGEAQLALELFSCMETEPDCLTYTAVVDALACLAEKGSSPQIRDHDKQIVKSTCLKNLAQIHSQAADFELDCFMATALIAAYAKCGSLVNARLVFQKLGAAPELVSWNAVILGHAENGQPEAALDLFRQMQRLGVAADAKTYAAVLTACSNLPELQAGKEIHALICRQGLEHSDAFVAVCLVVFYSRCGCAEQAEHHFGCLQERNLVAWTALISAYSREGASKQVFDLFQQMQNDGFRGDSITFLAILAACSHTGQLDLGKSYLKIMLSKHGVKPEVKHYHCVIDMLGRANLVEEAMRIVESMPYKPSVVTWTMVLDACRKWNRVSLGKHAFDSLVELNPRYASAYALKQHLDLYQDASR